MNTDQLLRVKPYRIGVVHEQHAYCGLRDEAGWIVLHQRELETINQLSDQPIAVGAFLGTLLAGSPGSLTLAQGIALLGKLSEAGFLAGDDVPGPTSNSAESHASQRLLPILATGPITRVHPLIGDLAQFCIHPATLLLSPVAALLLMTPALGSQLDPFADSMLNPAHILREVGPAPLMALSVFGLSLLATAMACLRGLLLYGLGAVHVAYELRLASWLVPCVTLDDRDMGMLPRNELLRFGALTLLLPFMGALIFFWSAVRFGDSPWIAWAGWCFVVIGLAQVSPLWWSALMRFLSSYLVWPQLKTQASHFLRENLLRRGTPKEQDHETGALTRRLERALIPMVTGTILWLYATWLLSSYFFLDLAEQSFALWQNWQQDAQAWTVARWLSFAISAVALICVATIALGAALRFIAVPLTNAWSMARVPLRKVRRSLPQNKGSRLSASAALHGFLRGIPIFHHLDDASIGKLTQVLEVFALARGETIVSQGEPGEHFFILAEGQAQVELEGAFGAKTHLATLEPGDSFGEIALLESGRRTATVRAASHVRVLALSRKEFDQIFPIGSPVREQLTTLIRRAKVIQETEALSHLSPPQVAALLLRLTSQQYAAGDVLIQQEDGADAAYIIESGVVSVEQSGGAVPLAELGRGNVVGTIGLLRSRPRTATVRCKTAVSVLKLDRETFAYLCLANRFVAALLNQLASRQLADQERTV